MLSTRIRLLLYRQGESSKGISEEKSKSLRNINVLEKFKVVLCYSFEK